MSKKLTLQTHILELLKVATPLMLSFLSILSMVFVDRLFLANYSIDALSAMSSAGTIALGITFGVQNITLIGSVFVAQLNGAKKYSELGAPVWQLFWFALATYIIFIPLAFISQHYFFVDSQIATQQQLVFKCIMFLGPLFAIVGSLQSFYNGQGKTLVITYLTIIGNIVNLILDPILIFGFRDIVPALGIIGANVATAASLIIQISILMLLFLSPKNKKLYGTNKWHLNIPLLKVCLKVGTPEAVAFGVEICFWGVFYNMMASIGQTYIVITAIAQNMVLLLFAFSLGLGHSTTIVAGNFIGAKCKHEIHKVFYAACLLIVFYVLSILILFQFGFDFIIGLFFYKQIKLGQITSGLLITIKPIIQQILPLLALYIGFESSRFMINGLLKAAGDTLFLLFIGVISILLFLIAPTYILMIVYQMPIQAFIKIWLFFAIMSSIISYIRFYRGAWQNIVIMK